MILDGSRATGSYHEITEWELEMEKLAEAGGTQVVGWNLAAMSQEDVEVASVRNYSGLVFELEPNCGNWSYHTKTRPVAIGPVLPPKSRHFNFTIMAPIKYCSFDHITT